MKFIACIVELQEINSFFPPNTPISKWNLNIAKKLERLSSTPTPNPLLIQEISQDIRSYLSTLERATPEKSKTSSTYQQICKLYRDINDEILNDYNAIAFQMLLWGRQLQNPALTEKQKNLCITTKDTLQRIQSETSVTSANTMVRELIITLNRTLLEESNPELKAQAFLTKAALVRTFFPGAHNEERLYQEHLLLFGFPTIDTTEDAQYRVMAFDQQISTTDGVTNTGHCVGFCHEWEQKMLQGKTPFDSTDDEASTPSRDFKNYAHVSEEIALNQYWQRNAEWHDSDLEETKYVRLGRGNYFFSTSKELSDAIAENALTHRDHPIRISLKSKEDKQGHVCSALLKSTGEMHWFDSNYGWFRFPNQKVFQRWFENRYSSYLKNCDHYACYVGMPKTTYQKIGLLTRALSHVAGFLRSLWSGVKYPQIAKPHSEISKVDRFLTHRTPLFSLWLRFRRQIKQWFSKEEPPVISNTARVMALHLSYDYTSKTKPTASVPPTAAETASATSSLEAKETASDVIRDESSELCKLETEIASSPPVPDPHLTEKDPIVDSTPVEETRPSLGSTPTH